MSGLNRGLGRGLDALLGGAKKVEENYDPAEVRQVAVGNIVPNPHQPRREFSEESLADLASSIKAQGVLQPILVRPLQGGRFELVAGERRLRASKLIGNAEIPVIVRDMTDQESLAVALIENLQREDLNPIEEALGYQQLQKQFGLNQDELSRQVGKSRSAVANSLRLLNLPETVRNDIQKGTISAGHGRAIMAVVGEDVQQELHERIKENGLTVRQAEAQATFWKQNNRFPGAGEEPVKKEGAKAVVKQEQDPGLLHLSESMTTLLDVAVKVAGTKEKGKITISYKSEDELRSIAEALGFDLPE